MPSPTWVHQASHDGNALHVSRIWGMGDLPVDGHYFYLSAEFRKEHAIKFADRGDQSRYAATI